MSEGRIMDDLVWSSPEKRAGIPHVPEFVASVFSNTFCPALCFFQFVKPVKVPHGEEAHHNPATKHGMDVAVRKTEETYARERNPIAVPWPM